MTEADLLQNNLWAATFSCVMFGLAALGLWGAVIWAWRDGQRTEGMWFAVVLGGLAAIRAVDQWIGAVWRAGRLSGIGDQLVWLADAWKLPSTLCIMALLTLGMLVATRSWRLVAGAAVLACLTAVIASHWLVPAMFWLAPKLAP